eukprot:Blabericola_migrator_1__13169@NODE_902_length_6138_cov_137_766595_g632_i0_p5_GENE_NODE_902_length_6138_cov_137_766595_g632_i0NODE_902_length_6138_cov_137_766595_g632_i0_p5_ORF_typecomplete_len228_score45_71_NODE_902_length_6138_cov_137_766595_g632_i044375120
MLTHGLRPYKLGDYLLEHDKTSHNKECMAGTPKTGLGRIGSELLATESTTASTVVKTRVSRPKARQAYLTEARSRVLALKKNQQPPPSTPQTHRETPVLPLAEALSVVQKSKPVETPVSTRAPTSSQESQLKLSARIQSQRRLLNLDKEEKETSQEPTRDPQEPKRLIQPTIFKELAQKNTEQELDERLPPAPPPPTPQQLQKILRGPRVLCLQSSPTSSHRVPEED